MAGKRFVAGLGLGLATATLAGCGSAERSPLPELSPTPSAQNILAIPSPPPGKVGAWPALRPCQEPGVYSWPADTSPEGACRVGAEAKKAIDRSQEVSFISYDGEITAVRGLGRCVLNMLAGEVTFEDGRTSGYAGLARVGRDGRAEVFFFPHRSDMPPDIQPAQLQPTEYDVYATEKNGVPVPIGVLIGQCQTAAPSPVPS